MKRLALFLALALLWAQPAFAVITPTNAGTATTASDGTKTTLAITTTTDAPPGSTAIAVIALNGASTGFTATDNASPPNTYALASTVCTYNTTFKLALLYSKITTDLPSGGTLTLNWTTANKATAAAIVATGLDTTAPLDVQGPCASGTATSASVASGALNHPIELAVAATGINSTTAGYAANAPFTTLTGNNSTGATIDWGYYVTPNASSVTSAPSWTTSRAYGTNVWTFTAPFSPTTHCGSLSLLGVGC